MDYDVDKEIDTLLRKAHGDGPVLVGDFASSGHLDADEISAFAENAIPENSRALYSAHLADCDRCRKFLSNVLMMNAEVAPAAASPLNAITIAERSAPWYRRLFLFPNLAYVMGSLVLVFVGFLGYSIIRNSGADGGEISQTSETAVTRGGPNAEVEQTLSADSSANTSANVANITPSTLSANSNSATAVARTPDPGAAGPKVTENNFVLDGVDASSADSVAAPAPPPSAVGATKPELKDARERDDLAKEKPQDKAAGAPLQEAVKTDSMLKQAPNSVSQSQVQSGPMNRNERQYNRQIENLQVRGRAVAKKSIVREDEESSVGRKVVGGKTFERKQGVWYDTTYAGHPTVNVRRGTSEFNKLDGGLRSIANSLSGTAVIVWGAKAYRIQ